MAEGLVKNLSFEDLFLILWIFIAIDAGIALGYFIPTTAVLLCHPVTDRHGK